MPLRGITVALAGHDRGIEPTALPSDWIARPIANDDWRLVSPSTRVAIACNVRDGNVASRRQELVDLHTYIDEVPYVVLRADQGSIGMTATHVVFL